MNTSKALSAAFVMGCGLLLVPAPASADHCGGNDTNDFSYMGTTCRFQRYLDDWSYNNDMVVTNEYSPFLVLERNTDANNCQNTTDQTFSTNATTSDTDTASYSVGVSVKTGVQASIGSDMTGKLGISVESGFTAGTQTGSTVTRTIGDTITTVVPGCSHKAINVKVTGFHNATVSATVSRKHWYRIHCDNSAYTTNWYVCDTETQNVSGSSGTACATKYQLSSNVTDIGCTYEQLSPDCRDGGVPDASVDAGAQDSGVQDSGTPPPPDASVPPVQDSGTPDASPDAYISYGDGGYY